MSVSRTSRGATRCPVRDDYNPFSPEATADPISTLASVANQDPVFFNTHSGRWSVAGYHEVREVLRDTKRFSNAAVILEALPTAHSAELAPRGAPDDHPALINTDPPTHHRIRKLANQAFTPRAVASWEPIIEQRVASLLDGFVHRGSGDFVASFSAPLPITVISDILGIPLDEWDRVFKWSWALLAARLPSLDESARDEAWRWIGDWTEYLEQMIVDRRREPRDDLLSRLMEASDAEDPQLSDDELRSVVSQLVIAGNETTRHLLSTLALRLTEHPQLARQLVDDKELVAKVVEEELRYAGPSRGLFRVATEDVRLGGATIQAGDVLQLCFAAANHDHRFFDEPFEFKLDRPDIGQHLGFGRGEHFCIGAPLARLEVKIALREIAARLPNLRRTDVSTLSWQPNVIITGLERLDLAWDVPGGSVR
ncbi:cytochrome P450 [Streptomyces sp. NPDC050619]|uniref:cytochrome P450 n=1 Tax=Streptomyces sp. NPDC050619 TaxID=3157214 RepID=UPI0034361BE8